MEDLNQPLDAGLGAEASDQGLKITDEIRAYWRETANWALFIAVLMFILIGFVMIGMLFGGYAAMSEGVASVTLILVFFLYGLVLFFPAWYYYKFSSLTKQAINFGDNNALEDGFDYLKRFYRFVGILVIAVFALYILLIIFGISMMGNMNRGF